MDEFAEYIERSLKERGFCAVLEDELERCCPNETDRAKNIQSFAESRGWIVSILNSDSGASIFEPHIRTARPALASLLAVTLY